MKLDDDAALLRLLQGSTDNLCLWYCWYQW